MSAEETPVLCTQEGCGLPLVAHVVLVAKSDELVLLCPQATYSGRPRSEPGGIIFGRGGPV